MSRSSNRRNTARTTAAFRLETLEPRTLLSGLTGEYFDNADFTSPIVTRNDATIMFDWGNAAPVAGMQADTFSVAWSGLLTPSTTGAYTFHLNSDEGARLWVNGRLLVDSWETGNPAASSYAVSLQGTRQYGIRVEYRDVSGAAHARLEWSSSVLPRQVIPGWALSPMPQASGDATKIMFLGDSITEAFSGHASYRFWLNKQLQAAGYNVDFIGTRDGVRDRQTGADGAAPLYPWFDQDHESKAGWTVDQLMGTFMFDDPDRTLKPDIAVIMIGNNDLAANYSIPLTMSRLGELVDELRVRNPNVKIVFTKILPNPERLQQTIDYNNAVAVLAGQLHTSQSPISLIDQHTGFNNQTETYDDPPVHPNEIGEKKIAGKYYDHLVAILGQPPHQSVPQPTGSLYGHVYADTNANGVRDDSEAGIPSRYVYLDHNNNGKRDSDEPVTVTSPIGRYLFQRLPVGEYTVRHHLGQFTQPTEPANGVQVAQVQQFVPSAMQPYDFGIRAATPSPNPAPTTGTISGRIFFDANGDGLRGGGEQPIANRYVYIDLNGNGLFEPNEPYSVTDAVGQYSFLNLKPGFYRIRPHIGPQIRSTAPLGGVYYLNLTAGQTIASAHYALALR